MERWLGFVAATAAAFLAVPFWERRLKKPSWQDRPRADRHHVRLVSKCGGPAWVTAFVIGVLLAWGDTAGLELFRVFLPMGAAAAVGRADDLDRIRPGRKFLVQILLVVAGVALLWESSWPSRSAFEWTAGIFVLAAVHLALHISDHLDGLLATASAAALGCLALGGRGPFEWTAAAGAGASLGFLLWNRPKARAFLGNMGSAVVAWWTTVALGVTWLRSESGEAGAFVWLLPLAWPIVDFLVVCTGRIARGVPPWVGGRDHLAHRLASRFGDRTAWAAVLFVSLLGALTAFVRGV